ncbi:MAG TPA: hypothetical protein VEN81_05035 [Planctomycetota bacterium]|nr:hypothetical protein [Planctomycetota bacterium]
MTHSAIQALLFLAALQAPAQEAKPRTELPVSAPTGWEMKDQDSTLLLTPKDLEAGKIYSVIVPGLPQKMGTVRKLLEVAKATLGEAGDFKPANEPVTAKTRQDWEFEIVIGSLTKNGRSLMAQAMGLKKGDKEGIILILSDSVPTMQKYADTFNAMVHLMDAPLPTPPSPAPASGTVDLTYTLPDGWTATPKEGSVLVSWTNERTKGQFDQDQKCQLIILPSQPLQDSVRKTFLSFWAANLDPAFETSIAPLPMVRRLKSGVLCAVDLDDRAKLKGGGSVPGLLSAGLFLLAQGNRVVPIVGMILNPTKALEGPLTAFLETARIPNAGEAKIVAFGAEEFSGEWKESSMSLASYVSSSGRIVGDASIATGSGITVNADGTFKSYFVGVGRGQTVTENDEGKWTLDDTLLTLEGKKRTRKLFVYGVGQNPKVGSFLVLAISFASETPVSLLFPRNVFQSTTYKKKE